jgi:hypothetical protein
VSHEEFPEDQYVKEIAYLLIDVPTRVLYVRKQSKTGGMFWSVATVGVTKDGSKTYYETFMQDSSFLEKDIKNFLDKRSWEKKEETKETASSSFDDKDILF